MAFLSNVLREDGGFDSKKAIIDSILILIREIPDAKEIGLAHLCEFIEVRCVHPASGNVTDFLPAPLSTISEPASTWGNVLRTLALRRPIRWGLTATPV